VKFLARRAAADETKQPEHDQHDDCYPDQIDQARSRVEQQPEHKENDRKYKQRVDHLDTSWAPRRTLGKSLMRRLWDFACRGLFRSVPDWVRPLGSVNHARSMRLLLVLL